MLDFRRVGRECRSVIEAVRKYVSAVFNIPFESVDLHFILSLSNNMNLGKQKNLQIYLSKFGFIVKSDVVMEGSLQCI